MSTKTSKAPTITKEEYIERLESAFKRRILLESLLRDNGDVGVKYSNGIPGFAMGMGPDWNLGTIDWK